MNNEKLACSLLAVLLNCLPIAAASGAQNITTFPGKRSILWAPGKKYALQCVSLHGDEYRNGLFLLKRDKTQKEPVILPSNHGNLFNHGIRVLWSPGGKMFLINDFSQGPGYVDAFLYNVKDISHPVDIGARLGKSITDQQLKKAFSGEVIITADSWLNSHAVRISVHMRDHPSLTDLTYDWDLKTKFKCIKQK